MAIERVTFQGTYPSGAVENVVHFHNADGATTHAAMAAYLQTNWINPLIALQSTGFRWVQMLIQKVDGSPGVSDTFAITPNQGTQSGDGAPPYQAGVIKLSTGFPGRKGRGRIFLGPFAIGTFSQYGTLTTGSYSAFQTLLLNAWRTKFISPGSAPIYLVVTSRSDPSDFHLVTALDVRPWSGVQRRRNYSVGI